MDTENPHTTDHLRSDINRKSGKLKDGAPEPAASPLGTDDEAAGTTADADRVAMAEEAEKKIAAGRKATR